MESPSRREAVTEDGTRPSTDPIVALAVPRGQLGE